MIVVFISSGLVLVLLWGMKHIEDSTNTVIVGRVTCVPDRALATLFTVLRREIRGAVETLRRDVFLRTLHSTTYVLLILVRAAEERLERFTAFVRRARRGVRQRPPGNLPGVKDNEVRSD